MDRNLSIKYGIIAGVGVMAFFLLFYLIDKALFFDRGVYWSSLFVYLGFMYLTCQKVFEKAEKPTYFTYLQTAFVVYIIANAMYYLLYFFLYNYIDPSLSSIQEEVVRASLDQNSELLNTEISSQLRSNLDKEGLTFTPNQAFFGFATGLIGGFVLAFIMAYFFDRKS
jgi:hypothetical protein